MSETNWDDEAVRVANHLARTAFAAHRGAVRGPSPGVSSVFGNDGYTTDGRVRSEVEHVRSRLAVAGVDVLGFGVSDRGVSWALLVRSEDLDRLTEIVWAGWRLACDSVSPGGRPGPAGGVGVEFEAVQRAIAKGLVGTSGDAGPGRPSLG